MNHTITSIATVLIALTSPLHANPTSWAAGPFDMPESAIFDAAHDRVIVSVIQGHPGEADGNGHLALLSLDGDISEPSWVTGLDAPKGMAIVGETLLVADLTRLHEIDLQTGRVLRSLEVDGAVFLNDITSDGKQAYISDFIGNRIWHYRAGDMTVWLEDEALAYPNGLYLDDERIVVGSWGQGMRDDFSTEVPGALLAVDLETQAINTIVPSLGNLDGVARIGDTLLVSDWITGQLFSVGADGTHTVVAEFPAGLADIATYENTLILPSMLEGTVSARTYP
ncbi:ATP/GTP-binding protein [Roseobacter cerasinus]|uniref:ATP/GTP-binding protein n=1 Tax=Roseobacter cerasinus TaxID=2602289 RepID=A0A640VZC1_9RHOB|nr:ATP/GTP-binding protein [Roseobacter cerasinus]GFE52451.1 ATP/GTP-binding protein [Roseobacter cerasinus]